MAKRRRKSSSSSTSGYMSRAQTDAKLSTLPQRQALDRERREAGKTYRQGRRVNRRVMGALGRTLRAVGRDYNDESNQIAGGYLSGVSGLSSLFAGMGSPAGAAASAAYGTATGGGMNLLASARQRGAEYTRSTRTQGAIEQKNNAANMLQEFRDTIEEIAQARRDLAQQEALMTKSLAAQYADSAAARAAMSGGGSGGMDIGGLIDAILNSNDPRKRAAAEQQVMDATGAQRMPSQPLALLKKLPGAEEIIAAELRRRQGQGPPTTNWPTLQAPIYDWRRYV